MVMWGNIFDGITGGSTVSFLDTLLTGPRIVAEIGMKIINRPADIIDNPRNVFCDPILHNSSMAKGLVDGVFKIAGKTDVHTSLYGPFGGRHDWMQQRKSYLGNRKINEIIFPATHDSGTFYLSLRPSEDAAKVVAALANISITSSQIHGWAQSQYLDFNGQLDLGIRWFDLRVGVSSYDNHDIRIFHSLESNDTLHSMLTPMGLWLRSNQGEIIVLKVHRAMGFSNKLDKYKDLINMFEVVFGDMLAPWSYFLQKKSYNEYVSSNKRCIVLFDGNKDINPDAPNTPPDWVWKVSECMGQLPHQIGEYGKLVYSPTESPETPEEYAAFATSSLIEYGAKAHNHEAVSKLKQANLQGKGAVVPLDFPEIPDRNLLDTIINLNS